MKQITTGSDCNGVGAFDHAIKRVLSKMENTEHRRVFACDMDKFARRSYIANHGEPEYYPENVYDRAIPTDPLDIYCTTPPCQSFSIAGNRQGKDDERGVLFFNSHQFIKLNNPRFFIFENVKGLLSDDKQNPKDKHGRTFREWLNMLGGLSVNGVPVLFPYENSVPYHIYWRVLNSKDHGVPQNRERVFIVGIRDDVDNKFTWPKTEPLTKRLKDVLKSEVDEKYFLSDKMVNYLTNHSGKHKFLGNGFKFEPRDPEGIASCINARVFKQGCDDNYISEKISPTLSTNKGEGIKVQVNSGVKKGFEEAGPYDSINFERPTSKTRKGRVGKQVAQTLDTKQHQAVVVQMNPSTESGGKQPYQGNRVYSSEGIFPCLNTDEAGRFKVCIPVLTPNRPNKRQNGRRFKEDGDPSLTLTAQDKHGVFDGYKIRRLTPLECHRLQDFPDDHYHKAVEAGLSDSQLYKQMGNSITVRVLEKIIEKLPL